MTVVRGRTITPTNIDTILAECDPTQPTEFWRCKIVGTLMFTKLSNVRMTCCEYVPDAWPAADRTTTEVGLAPDQGPGGVTLGGSDIPTPQEPT